MIQSIYPHSGIPFGMIRSSSNTLRGLGDQMHGASEFNTLTTSQLDISMSYRLNWAQHEWHLLTGQSNDFSKSSFLHSVFQQAIQCPHTWNGHPLNEKCRSNMVFKYAFSQQLDCGVICPKRWRWLPAASCRTYHDTYLGKRCHSHEKYEIVNDIRHTTTRSPYIWDNRRMRHQRKAIVDKKNGRA